VPGVSYDVRAVAAADGSHLATTEISADFPGSPVLLGFTFGFDEEGRVTRLVIAPRVRARPDYGERRRKP
jgi:hypothetical protein